MSSIKLGNGAAVQVLTAGQKAVPGCDCYGSEVGLILSTMGMAGSNLYNLYPGVRCAHGEPIKASAIAYVVENYKEDSIKFKGKGHIKGALEHLMIGSIALVFFRSNGHHGGTGLDLYITNKLWIDSGVADEADEMWIWVLGGKLPKLGHGQKAKSHKPHVVIF